MKIVLKSFLVGSGIAAMVIAAAPSASAQMKVNSRLHMSGSCASCDLSRRDMSRLSMTSSNFSEANFSRSNLSGGDLDHSNLTGAQFNRAYLVRSKGEAVNFQHAVLTDATMTEAQLSHSDFSKADMQRADLSSGIFKGSDFSDTTFTNGQAPDADFTDAVFSLAKLHHTNFNGAKFVAAKLQFTEFGMADLTGADFTAADFAGADMSRARGLTQAQLNQGCGNDGTRLPEGMTVAYCPEYITLASADSALPRTRTPRSMIINGVDIGPKLDQLEITKAGIAENIKTLERAVKALPRDGAAGTRAELRMSLEHLRKLHDAL